MMPLMSPSSHRPVVTGLLLLLLSNISTPIYVFGEEFIPRCGDCWCVNDPNDQGIECPDYVEGIHDLPLDDTSFPATYASFKLVSDPILLRDESNCNECFPFKNRLGPLEYEKSKLSQCTLPPSGSDKTDNAVCAFRFLNDGDAATATTSSSCEGREYELITYESKEQAENDCAVVTHSGACGVCSNAADLAVRLRTSESLEKDAIKCSTIYFTGRDFNELVNCFMRNDNDDSSGNINIGFTYDCALLWAHNSATNAEVCVPPCGASDLSIVNTDPPQCDLSECLACSQNQTNSFGIEFNALSGRTAQNSGITESIARPCNQFTPIIHNPCFNQCPNITTTSNITAPKSPCAGDDTSASPTPNPTTTSSSSRSIVVFYNKNEKMALLFVGFLLTITTGFVL